MSSILDLGMANKNSIHNISENLIQLATHNYCVQCYYYKGSRFWQMSIRILHKDRLLNPIDDFKVYWGGTVSEAFTTIDLPHLLEVLFAFGFMILNPGPSLSF